MRKSARTQIPPFFDNDPLYKGLTVSVDFEDPLHMNSHRFR